MQSQQLQCDVAIVGAGLVGLATAYQIARRQPRLRILVLEKEHGTAVHQSGHNSGVLHSGLYYRPGTQRARNCVSGREALVAFARQHRIRHDVCGKLVVAATPAEQARLPALLANGRANGLSDVELVDGAGIRAREPHCRGAAALWVPYAGIIDFPAVAATLRRQVETIAAANRVLLGCEVRRIAHRADGIRLHTSRGLVSARHLITCAGLQADRMALADGARPGVAVVGFRGDFFALADNARHLVRNLIYPVPNPRVPFLGVHFTRGVDGTIECGPNAVFTFRREGYRKTDFDLRDTVAALGYPGTWRLFGSHLGFGFQEYRRAFSRRRFLHQLRRLVPALRLADLRPARSGVRAIAIDRSGAMIDDFRIVHSGNAIHVVNAPSPAATACLAIGDQVADMAAAAGFLAPVTRETAAQTLKG